MSYADNLNYLDDAFEGDDNREAAALNALLSAFGGKYTHLNGVEVRVADHFANLARVWGNGGSINVTITSDGIRVTDCRDNRESKLLQVFTFEQADDVYDYVESLCPEEVEELN